MFSRYSQKKKKRGRGLRASVDVYHLRGSLRGFSLFAIITGIIMELSWPPDKRDCLYRDG